MKANIRVPTIQYGYIEVEVEGDANEIIDQHQELLKAYTNINGDGLPEVEWRDTLDRYLTEQKMSSDVYEKMNNEERTIINEIKKSIKRIEAKQ